MNVDKCHSYFLLPTIHEKGLKLPTKCQSGKSFNIIDSESNVSHLITLKNPHISHRILGDYISPSQDFKYQVKISSEIVRKWKKRISNTRLTSSDIRLSYDTHLLLKVSFPFRLSSVKSSLCSQPTCKYLFSTGNVRNAKNILIDGDVEMLLADDSKEIATVEERDSGLGES